MKRKRFNEAQIIGVLQEAEAGGKKQDLCRKYGITEQTFYRWRSKYGGAGVRSVAHPLQHRPSTQCAGVSQSGTVPVDRRAGRWQSRSLRDLGKGFKWPTFPQPPRRL